jgi:hypothetical protein
MVFALAYQIPEIFGVSNNSILPDDTIIGFFPIPGAQVENNLYLHGIYLDFTRFLGYLYNVHILFCYTMSVQNLIHS